MKKHLVSISSSKSNRFTLADRIGIFAVIALAAGLALSYSLSNGFAFTPRVAAQNGCTVATPQGLQLENRTGTFSETKRIFEVTPGSSATICVSYKIESSASTQLPATLNFQAHVDRVSATQVNDTNESGFIYSYANATDINVTANPSSVQIQSNMVGTDIVVQYTISASSASSGAYAFWYTNQCPNLEPLAVGSSYVSASNFQGFYLPGSCNIVPPISAGTVVGYSQASISWLGG